MKVYINYPNPHITVHKNPACKQIQAHQKSDQRLVNVNDATLKKVLSAFNKDAYDFRADPQWDDMWMDISLSTPEQEIGFVHIMQAILGKRYKPLAKAPISFHCE
jgi:hypothetical protein